ncbi:MAG: peroxidase family protein [Bdellovibrionales bacterium]
MNSFQMMTAVLILASSLQGLASGSAPATPSWYDREWYRKSLVQGLIYYSKVKNFLLEHNVLPVEDARPSSGAECRGQTQYRSFEGFCNDLTIPMSGSKGTAFSRNMKSAYSLRQSGTEPDPRLISRKLMTREKFIPNRFSNLLAASFLQFTIHDWVHHEENYQDLDEIPLSSEDPIFQQTGQTSLLVPKTVAKGTGRSGIPLYRNSTSHWFDASQIYGTTKEEAAKLREFSGGRLKVENNLLPRDGSGQELSGDTRNWWLGLGLMHTLFVREHNLIAQHLGKIYPRWDDERIFQTARLIVGASTAKLFMTELTGARFNNDILRTITIGNWYGPVNAALNFRKHGLKTPATPGWESILGSSSTLTGLIGGKMNNRGVGFAMTEEWAQVYKYHTLVPDAILVQPTGEAPLSVATEETRGRETRSLIEKYGLATLVKSFGHQPSGRVTLNNVPAFLQNLDVPVLGRIDVAAFDVYRERERGLLRFNEFRRHLGLAPYRNLLDMTQDQAMAARLREIYGENIEMVDLTVGLMAEARDPQFELGETTIQSLALLAIRRIEADRFYTTDYRKEVYTEFGLKWIDNLTFKGLLLRHFPELREDLKNIENPFRQWNEVR